MTVAVAPQVRPLQAALADYAVLAVPVVVVVATVLLVVRSVVLVGEDQVHVVTRDGAVEDVIESGLHLRSPVSAPGWTIDTSPIQFTLAGSVVETADGHRVQGDVSGRFRVADPEALVTRTRAFPDDVRRRIDEAYVTQLERCSWGDHADPASTLEARIGGEVERALERWGVELLDFELAGLGPVE